jgi:predicted dehydrogenase
MGSSGSLPRLGYKSPNEKLNVASIGAGGKASSDIDGCASSENIVALCDVDDKSAAHSFEKYDKATKYKDFRKMLDKEKSVDAVIVTIPDFMHATAAIWAWSAASMYTCRNRWCAPSGKRAR